MVLMISGLQIRAARIFLRWTASDLAKKSGVSVSTIQRLETFDGLPSGNMNSISALHDAFVQAGIEFLGTADEDPGVRLKTK